MMQKQIKSDKTKTTLSTSAYQLLLLIQSTITWQKTKANGKAKWVLDPAYLKIGSRSFACAMIDISVGIKKNSLAL
ncbi:hypothetical protein GLAREA_01055 [Glarea lozoyensis ATCC 20868]|uniref:Uncharacterized protein n=1 Tax=Glarea lozoyensis (strain ATCC 20868 / MF5171) TaxID=1116229 RepID=S3CW95_GLAL2|nr:uncharacterized protein GLAREA_01055 [Glarea lozoyensis ATCC 20868]EPE29895.1 hypothetical protein GLAREA_01055 [Glarea lozoyensis ATCC 20868]